MNWYRCYINVDKKLECSLKIIDVTPRNDMLESVFETRTHSPIHLTAHTDACKTYRITFTIVSLGMNPRVS